MALEFSSELVEGLQHLGAHIPIELTRKLINNSVKLKLTPDASVPTDPEINKLNNAKVNQSEYAIITLYALATRHGCSRHKLRTELEQLSIHPAAMEELLKVYEEYQKDFYLQQLQTAPAFPHATDVEWKIVCDVKSSAADYSSRELMFHINLGKQDPKLGTRVPIADFHCNTEELQLLLNKLNEIKRHCETLASK